VSHLILKASGRSVPSSIVAIKRKYSDRRVKTRCYNRDRCLCYSYLWRLFTHLFNNIWLVIQKLRRDNKIARTSSWWILFAFAV